MEESTKEPTGLRAIKGGRRSFSIGGTVASIAAVGIGALVLIGLGCAILGGAWIFEQLWNAVT